MQTLFDTLSNRFTDILVLAVENPLEDAGNTVSDAEPNTAPLSFFTTLTGGELAELAIGVIMGVLFLATVLHAGHTLLGFGKLSTEEIKAAVRNRSGGFFWTLIGLAASSIFFIIVGTSISIGGSFGQEIGDALGALADSLGI